MPSYDSANFKTLSAAQNVPRKTNDFFAAQPMLFDKKGRPARTDSCSFDENANALASNKFLEETSDLSEEFIGPMGCVTDVRAVDRPAPAGDFGNDEWSLYSVTGTPHFFNVNNTSISLSYATNCRPDMTPQRYHDATSVASSSSIWWQPLSVPCHQQKPVISIGNFKTHRKKVRRRNHVSCWWLRWYVRLLVALLLDVQMVYASTCLGINREYEKCTGEITIMIYAVPSLYRVPNISTAS
jgi:hypothetical protein